MNGAFDRLDRLGFLLAFSLRRLGEQVTGRFTVRFSQRVEVETIVFDAFFLALGSEEFFIGLFIEINVLEVVLFNLFEGHRQRLVVRVGGFVDVDFLHRELVLALFAFGFAVVVLLLRQLSVRIGFGLGVARVFRGLLVNLLLLRRRLFSLVGEVPMEEDVGWIDFGLHERGEFFCARHIRVADVGVRGAHDVGTTLGPFLRLLLQPLVEEDGERHVGERIAVVFDRLTLKERARHRGDGRVCVGGQHVEFPPARRLRASVHGFSFLHVVPLTRRGHSPFGAQTGVFVAIR